MNPGLVVKLRPAGPWRIGPDSGARNRVDFIYHSDSLYSAVTSAMVRMGSLDDWLDATARGATPAVCFSSCYPFLDEIGFIVPPRTIWPPTSPSLMSARVRWKSARFVPLGIVQAILAGQRLDDNHWSVDGASECLVPAGRPGPFRTGVRWSAAVDRLTGSTERHSTACIEFRPGAGLWTIVSFLDQAAHDRWLEPVKGAFRLLADSGFGGERSRGWGRSESPEFIDGLLPDMILPAIGQPAETSVEPVATEAPAEPAIEVIAAAEEAVATPAPAEESPAVEARVEALAESTEMVAEGGPAEPPPAEVVTVPDLEPALAAVESPVEAAGEPEAATESSPPQEAATEPEPEVQATPEGWNDVTSDPEAPTPPEEPQVEGIGEAVEMVAEGAPAEPPPELEPTEAAASLVAPSEVAPLVVAASAPEPVRSSSTPVHPHWLLSLFTPAEADGVDWRRGNYTLLARGGRVDSPAGSGELKKQIQMVTEGSVVYAPSGPCGSAADVAPDGFAHPVFRAGFAVSIPLPEVS